jgi:hypothetical protein
MEFNLQRLITSSSHDLIFPHTSYPALTPFPARDFVTPGVGGATNLYSFYVPLFHEISPYNIQKEEDSNVTLLQGDQIGTGNDQLESEDTSNVNTNADNVVTQSSNENPNTESLKRKISDGIEHSFLHPKVFKTKTVQLPVKVSTNTVKVAKVESASPRAKNIISHKFKIAD